jgi:hypothetical protein
MRLMFPELVDRFNPVNTIGFGMKAVEAEFEPDDPEECDRYAEAKRQAR